MVLAESALLFLVNDTKFIGRNGIITLRKKYEKMMRSIANDFKEKMRKAEIKL